MNGMDIYTAIGEADERYIAEAMTQKNGGRGKKAADSLRKTKPARRIGRTFAAAAAGVLGVVAVSAAVFGTRPALAAEIPGVSSLVYAAAPERTANDADRARIEALVGEAVSALAANDYGAAARCFRDGSLNGRGNYLAAAYVDRLLVFGDEFPESAEAGELEITGLKAEQKAYRFTASVRLDLVSRDGKRHDAEECTVKIWENAKGMFIESIEFSSGAYAAYAEEYEATFGRVPESGADPEVIPLDNSYLSYVRVIAANEGARQREDRLNRMIAELDSVSASPKDKAARLMLLQSELDKAAAEITPEAVTAEETAAELMYRYWMGGKTGEMSEFADIMERNEATDLFWWDAQLTAEQVSLGVLAPLATVEKDSAMILEVLEETEDTLRARFYVHTETSDGVSLGVGEEIILTLQKTDGGFIIVGFDREVGDGLYLNDLKPAAERFKADGFSWQEAGQMACEEVRARLVRDAEWLAEHGY